MKRYVILLFFVSAGSLAAQEAPKGFRFARAESAAPSTPLRPSAPPAPKPAPVPVTNKFIPEPVVIQPVQHVQLVQTVQVEPVATLVLPQPKPMPQPAAPIKRVGAVPQKPAGTTWKPWGEWQPNTAGK